MNIDVTKIEGYETMTPEEKVQALEGFQVEVPTADYSGYIPKKDFDKVSSELAEWKRKHNALLSEEEQKKIAHDEELAELRREVEENRKERTLTEYKAQFISMGYEEELAEETARASIEGDIGKVFSNHKKFLDAHDKALEQRLLAKTPRPDSTGAKNTATPMTKEQIVKIANTEERQRAIAENIELFQND